MELVFQDAKFCCWGADSQGGTYLLRLLVRQPLLVTFGRFRGGQPIDVSAGEYFYVGSALAPKGSTSLARRLLRHASRSDATAPQPIRAAMLRQFPRWNLGPKLLNPPSTKKLRWHIDYLLDEAEVDLTAVYLVREKPPAGSATDGYLGKNLREVGTDGDRSMETAVARWLLTFAEITPLVEGLGATDDPGGTHVLQVTAVPAWWTAFPQHLTHFLRSVAP